MLHDLLFPVVKGVGPTPFPRPERLYFQIRPPIPTAGLPETDEAIRSIREQAATSIEAGIADLQRYREADPARGLLPRATRAVARRLRVSPSR